MDGGKAIQTGLEHGLIGRGPPPDVHLVLLGNHTCDTGMVHATYRVEHPECGTARSTSLRTRWRR